MPRIWVVGATVIALTAASAAQKPHGQVHHAKAGEEHKAAAITVEPGRANGAADVQLKHLEQQTAKVAGANPQKQKGVAPAKFKPAPAGGKTPKIDFKSQKPQATHMANAAPKSASRARH